MGASVETGNRLICGELQQPRLPIFAILYPATFAWNSLVLFWHFHLDFDWEFLTLSFPCLMLCSCGCLEATFSASVEWGSSSSCGCLVRCHQEPLKSELCVGFDSNPTHSSLQSPELTDFLAPPSRSMSQGLPHGSYTSIPCPLSCSHSLLWGIKQISNIFPPVRTLEKFQQWCAWLDSALLFCIENKGTILLQQLIV